MKNIFYEIFIQSESGPCVVSERGFNNEISFLSPEIAIETAKKKKEFYPNQDFIVHKVMGNSREVIFRTRNQSKFIIKSKERGNYFVAIHSFTPFYSEKSKAAHFNSKVEAHEYAMKELFITADAFEIEEVN